MTEPLERVITCRPSRLGDGSGYGGSANHNPGPKLNPPWHSVRMLVEAALAEQHDPHLRPQPQPLDLVIAGQPVRVYVSTDDRWRWGVRKRPGLKYRSNGRGPFASREAALADARRLLERD